jgi:DNA-binding transcriptional MerR regulator
MKSLKIGALASATGTAAPTVRYYEEIGLLPRAQRQEGSQRVYTDADVARLTFVRRCRELGFPIEQVRQLVSLADDRERSCLEARDLARDQWMAVQQKLAEVQALERAMAAFVDSCEQACAGGPGHDCQILLDLGKPRSGEGTVEQSGCCA